MIVKWKLKGKHGRLQIHIITTGTTTTTTTTHCGDKIYCTFYSTGMFSKYGGCRLGTSYGFSGDDQVEIILNLNNATLSYQINGKYKDVLIKDIPRNENTKYKLAISLSQKGDYITLLECNENIVSSAMKW